MSQSKKKTSLLDLGARTKCHMLLQSLPDLCRLYGGHIGNIRKFKEFH